MAAITNPRPGTKFGPCVDCAHVDCQVTREFANAPCRMCGEKIGYDAPYYGEGNDIGKVVHESCLLREQARA